MKNAKALTLLELLIASSIFVVVMVSIYSAIHAGVFGYRNIEETLDTYQAARSILERINLDISNSFAYQDGNTKFSGNEKELSFLTLVDTFRGDKITQEYAFVSYKLEEDKLMRLCRLNQESLNDKSEVQPKEFAFNVEINFKYGYIPAEQQEIDFKKSWAIDSDEEKKALPLAVKIDLTVKGKAGQKFERTIFLPLAKIK